MPLMEMLLFDPFSVQPRVEVDLVCVEVDLVCVE